MLVRRTGSRLGIDINERNVIVKLIPGTHAAREKQLREGDVVVAVDGEALNGRWLAQAPAPHCPAEWRQQREQSAAVCRQC